MTRQTGMLLLLVGVLAACQPSEESQNAQLRAQLDTLNRKLDTILAEKKRDEGQQKVDDSLSNARPKPDLPAKTWVLPARPTPKPELRPVKSVEEQAVDTLKYFFKGGRSVCLKVYPWVERKQKWVFFDRQGRAVYEQQDVRNSYSIRTEILRFHPSGAIAEIKVSTHPDASMYWYESVIRFDEEQNPVEKVDTELPEHSIVYPGSNVSYWKEGRWVKKDVER